MEPEGSLLRSQVPVTSPFLELDRFSPCPPHPTFCRAILILLSLLLLGLLSCLFPSVFSTKTLYTPLLSRIHATCPAHLILLDLITQTRCGEEYTSFLNGCNMIRFDGEELSAPRPTPKLEDYSLSAVRDCLCNKFATNLHFGGRSSILKLRTLHAMVKGAHLL